MKLRKDNVWKIPTGAGQARAARKESLPSFNRTPCWRSNTSDNFRRKTPLEPEKALLLAVLEDGIRCFQDNILPRE